jgi:hypothetical protein
MNNETLCSCPGDMYECDPKIGCICNEEKNCQGGQQIFSLAPLSAAEDPGTSQSSAIAIVVTVLILALLLTILGIWYYRRRTKILQKDLQNRSVYYVENSILDPARHHHNQNDLIIPNSDPVILEEEFDGPPLVGGAAAAVVPNSTANNVPNNLLAKPRFEKNVNIDAFKLGMDSESPVGACGRNTPVNSGACGRSTPLSGGACGGADDAETPDVTLKKPLNVNMFDEVESPIKNNFLLEHNRKINKPKINNVINNTLEEDAADIDPNDDEIAIAKMSNYLGSYPDPEKK